LCPDGGVGGGHPPPPPPPPPPPAPAQPEERYEYSCTHCSRRLRPSETWRSRPDTNGAQTHNCWDHRRPLATLVRQPDGPLVWS
jgi:hypothetical protein